MTDEQGEPSELFVRCFEEEYTASHFRPADLDRDETASRSGRTSVPPNRSWVTSLRCLIVAACDSLRERHNRRGLTRRLALPKYKAQQHWRTNSLVSWALSIGFSLLPSWAFQHFVGQLCRTYITSPGGMSYVSGVQSEYRSVALTALRCVITWVCC